MRIVNEELKDGRILQYQELESGTCYHIETPEPIIKRLEDARINRYRVRLFFGDTKTGQDWNEENDTMGRVERSTGRIKVPLLLPNIRSTGGGAILDHCIVKIMKGKQTVYEHPGYDAGYFEVRRNRVFKNGEIVANFKTEWQAKRYVAFMKGERHTKGGK